MADEEFDAVVVGASLAGCTTSILLARSGAKVALVERHAQPESHKRICTHFIQASALPVLKTLGLDRLIEEAGGVRNPIELHTASGWVGSHLEQSADGAPDHGYNIRRLRLDPMVRALAARTPGVTLMTGRPAAGLTQVRGRVSGVRLGGTGEARCFGARLVVAADGRNSALAEMAGAPTKSAVNHRHAVLAPLRRVDRRRGETSQMWLHGAEVAYVFPNDDGVTVLAWMGPKDILEKHQGEPLDLLKAKNPGASRRAATSACRSRRGRVIDQGLPEPVASTGSPGNGTCWRCDAQCRLPLGRGLRMGLPDRSLARRGGRG